MRIDIKSTNFEATAAQLELVKKKVNKLEKFYDHIIDCLVFLTSDGHSAKGNEESVEIKLIVKDFTLFCKESSNSIEQSIDQAVENMTRQLKKYKQKHG
ncbi:MAG: ribosome-associated translation inhibitor RaiA [Bacteroidetes bacterium]|nr:ribosome-associated translation inhibitor RaiA [Bacteroidota bacterium]